MSERLTPEDLSDRVEAAIGPTLIRQVAEIIDPGAFAVWYDGTGPDAQPHKPDTRTRLAQSEAECKAIRILKIALAHSHEELRRKLTEHELEGWRQMGVPVDVIELRKAVEGKYA